MLFEYYIVISWYYDNFSLNSQIQQLILHPVCTWKDPHLHHHRHLLPPPPRHVLQLLSFHFLLRKMCCCSSHDTFSFSYQTVATK